MDIVARYSELKERTVIVERKIENCTDDVYKKKLIRYLNYCVNQTNLLRKVIVLMFDEIKEIPEENPLL